MDIRDLMVTKGGKIVLITDEPSNVIKKAGCDALAADLAAKYALVLQGALPTAADGPLTVVQGYPLEEATLESLEEKVDDLVAKFDAMAEAIGDDA